MSSVAVLSAAFDTFNTATGRRPDVRRNVWSRSLPRLTAPSAVIPKDSRPMAAPSASANRGGAPVKTASIASISLNLVPIVTPARTETEHRGALRARLQVDASDYPLDR